MTTTAPDPDLRLPTLARELAYLLEQRRLPVRSVYLDPGIEGLLPVRGYVRVSDRADLNRWAKALLVPVTDEPGPLPDQTTEYAERAVSDPHPYGLRVYFVRRATDAEVADR